MARLPRRVNKGAPYHLEGRSLALFRLLDGQENLLRTLPRLRPSI
jgi:hypothetical protein